MNRFFGIAAAASLVAVASPAFAQDMAPAAQPSSQGAVHEGFYGNVHVGAGYMNWASGEDDKTSVGGFGTALGLAAGYAPMKNLVILGELNYEMALGPSFSVDGKEQKGVDELSMNFFSIGPGALYFLDNGINFGGSLLYSSASFDYKGAPDSDAATGFGLRVGAGKQFMLNENFDLNVGANVFWSALSTDIKGTSETASSNAMSFGLTVSGAYN